MSGKLIVLEGLDGTGKTTQAAILNKRLNQRGIDSVLTAEPTNGEIGLMIRKEILGAGESSATALAAMFLADRIEHNINKEKGIIKMLNEGVSVVSDRYYYSSMAYQGKEGLLDWVMALNLDCPDIKTPDVCVFLDMEPKKCMDRIYKNRTKEEIDVFENEYALAEIRSAFYNVFSKLKDKQNIVIVDADMDIESLSDIILENVLKFYNFD